MPYFKMLFLSVLMIPVSVSGQTVISDVTLPATLNAGAISLNLNGGGLREKLWIDLYVGGLYLTSKSDDAQAIIDADKPMAIYIEIVSTLITSEKMITAVDEGFVKSTKGKTNSFKSEIEDFKSAFSETIQENDTYKIVYQPNVGVTVAKNGKLLKTIKGHDFKKALFGIWLCDEPADENLKEGMLGKD